MMQKPSSHPKGGQLVPGLEATEAVSEKLDALCECIRAFMLFRLRFHIAIEWVILCEAV